MKPTYLTAVLLASLSLGGVDIRASAPEAQVRQFTTALLSPLPPLRHAAADNLGQLGPGAVTAVPVLIKALDDDDGLVRGHAAWALGKIGQPSEQVIAALCRRLGAIEGEWPVRHNAALSLSWLGEPAVPGLRKLLRDEFGWTRAYAADALLRIDSPKHAKELAPVVAGLLGNQEETVRTFSALLAGRLGKAGGETVPGLVTLLRDPSANARQQAMKALLEIGPPARAALPAIEKALKEDTDDWVRINAVAALGELGEASPRVISALVTALSDKKDRVCAYAAQALAKFGEPAVPELQRALASERKFTRMSAADSLAFMGNGAGRHASAAAESLVSVLQKDTEWEVRSRAATALGLLGDSREKVRSALSARLDDDNEVVRLHAKLALERLGQPPSHDAKSSAKSTEGSVMARPAHRISTSS